MLRRSALRRSRSVSPPYKDSLDSSARPMGVTSQNSTLPCAITSFPVSLPLSSPGDVWPRLPLFSMLACGQQAMDAQALPSTETAGVLVHVEIADPSSSNHLLDHTAFVDVLQVHNSLKCLDPHAIPSSVDRPFSVKHSAETRRISVGNPSTTEIGQGI